MGTKSICSGLPFANKVSPYSAERIEANAIARFAKNGDSGRVKVILTV